MQNISEMKLTIFRFSFATKEYYQRSNDHRQLHRFTGIEFSLPHFIVHAYLDRVHLKVATALLITHWL